LLKLTKGTKKTAVDKDHPAAVNAQSVANRAGVSNRMRVELWLYRPRSLPLHGIANRGDLKLGKKAM